MNCCWYGISPSIFGYYRCFCFCCCCCWYWMNAKVNMHHWCCSQLIWMQNRHLILPFLRAKKPNKKSWQVIKCQKTSVICIRATLSHREMPPLGFVPSIVVVSIQREKIKIEISNKTINDTDIGKKSIGNKHFKESKQVCRTLYPSCRPLWHGWIKNWFHPNQNC